MRIGRIHKYTSECFDDVKSTGLEFIEICCNDAEAAANFVAAKESRISFANELTLCVMICTLRCINRCLRIMNRIAFHFMLRRAIHGLAQFMRPGAIYAEGNSL